jgi:geranylgeranyl diphosphate synthase, type II
MISPKHHVDRHTDLWTYIESYRPRIESSLRAFLPVAPRQIETRFNEALEYALFPGGKRLRPVLTLLGAEVTAGAAKSVLPAAVAVEFIHSSSLIFDDLPCMDNSVRRRGKSSVHEKYGESLAILVGLALLNASYGLIFVNHADLPDRALVAHGEFVECIGASGVVGGQSVDLQSFGPVTSDIDSESVRNLKTSALMRLALRTGAILAGADYLQLNALSRFAEHLGDAYQLSDDLMDAGEDFATFANQNAAEASNNRLLTYIDDGSRVLLENFPASDARGMLLQLIEYLAVRGN